MDSTDFATESQEATTATSDSGGGGSGEQYQDLAKTRLVLKSTCDQLRSRELVYLKASASSGAGGIDVAGLHADCLFVLNADVECEALRAAHAAAAVLAAAAGAGSARDDSAERRRLWRRTLKETSGLWMDYCRTATRLSCRIEAAFLRQASRFAVSVDADGAPRWEVGAAAAEARQLWLLADAMTGLGSHMGLELSPEFDACRDCLRRYLSHQDQQQLLDVDSSPTDGLLGLQGNPELKSPGPEGVVQKRQQLWLLLETAWLPCQRAGRAAKSAVGAVLGRLHATPGLFVACIGGCLFFAVATGQFQAIWFRLVCWDWGVHDEGNFFADEDPF